MVPLLSEKMAQGLAEGVFPGGALLVRYRGQIVFHEVCGAASVVPEVTPIGRETLFDLASLTKPLATAAAILLLVQEKALALSDPVQRFIPSFSGDRKGAVTLFHLLNHSAGLPAWKPYYAEAGHRTAILRSLHAEPLIAPPSTERLYSDLGFILLGEVIETVSGERLDRFCARRIFAPAGCETAGFRLLAAAPDSENAPAPAVSIAATSRLSDGRVLRGEVDDDNARAMGGVAGHAGLFATAADVDRLLGLWTGALDGAGIFDKHLATQFVACQTGPGVPTGSTWGLGWDTPSPLASSSGRFFSAESFGHLGFTGTSIWFDRRTTLGVILLTHRVHPDRTNQKIKRFRPELHDLIFQEVVGGNR